MTTSITITLDDIELEVISDLYHIGKPGICIPMSALSEMRSDTQPLEHPNELLSKWFSDPETVYKLEAVCRVVEAYAVADGVLMKFRYLDNRTYIKQHGYDNARQAWETLDLAKYHNELSGLNWELDNTLEEAYHLLHHELNNYVPPELKNRKKSHTEVERAKVSAQYEKLFLQIGRRDGFSCAVCGAAAPDLQIDHIHPVSKGGTSEIGNLQLLCSRCNREKSSQLPQDIVRVDRVSFPGS